MPQLTQEIKNELKELVYDFIAEECEVDKASLNDETNVIDDLDGDSLLLIELVETLKKKYHINIQLQAVGKYLLKKPAETIGQVVNTAHLLYEHENDIVNLIL